MVGRREECGSGCGGVEGECGGEEGECVLWGGGESVCGGEEGKVWMCVCCGEERRVWECECVCVAQKDMLLHVYDTLHTHPHPHTLHAHPHPHTLHTHPHPPHTTSSHTHTPTPTPTLNSPSPSPSLPTHYQLLVCLSEGACKRYSIALDSWRRNKHSRLLFKSLFSCEV